MAACCLTHPTFGIRDSGPPAELTPTVAKIARLVADVLVTFNAGQSVSCQKSGHERVFGKDACFFRKSAEIAQKVRALSTSLNDQNWKWSGFDEWSIVAMRAWRELQMITNSMGLIDDLPLLIGPAIRRAREEAGITKKALAGVTGCTAGAIGRFERGVDMLPGSTIDAILDATGVSVVSNAPC